MDLNLENRLTDDEQNELKRRAYSAMEQLFLEGISTGRELGREELHFETEKYIADKILFLSNYFITDNLWRDQPPANYREKKEVPKYNAKESSAGCDIDEIDSAQNVNVEQEANSMGEPLEKPEWANKEKPFK